MLFTMYSVCGTNVKQGSETLEFNTGLREIADLFQFNCIYVIEGSFKPFAVNINH